MHVALGMYLLLANSPAHVHVVVVLYLNSVFT